MRYIGHTIRGVPYGKSKSRSDKNAPERWTKQIKEQTRCLPRIKNPCVLKVTFLLPPDKYPGDLPDGPDLDNLLKRFLDALNDTVFAEAVGKDSCVMFMTAMKAKVALPEETGAHFEIMTATVPQHRD